MTLEATEHSVTGRESPTEEAVMGVLRQCYDPCCKEKGISVVDMGLIESIAVNDGDVRIEMLLTSGWCPFAMHLLTDMQSHVAELEGVNHVDVNIVWGPAWTPARLSEEAKQKLSLPMEKLLPLREARLARERAERVELKS